MSVVLSSQESLENCTEESSVSVPSNIETHIVSYGIQSEETDEIAYTVPVDQVQIHASWLRQPLSTPSSTQDSSEIENDEQNPTNGRQTRRRSSLMRHFATRSESQVSLMTLLNGISRDCSRKKIYKSLLETSVLLGLGLSIVVLLSMNLAGRQSKLPHSDDNFIAIKKLILEQKISALSYVSDETSPQYKGLAWVAKLNQTDDGENEVIEKYILSTFIFGLQSRKESLLLGDSVYDKCEWKWVSCDKNKTVTGIFLRNKSLQGYIVEEIKLLENLKHLDLSINNLGSEIPSFVGEMSNLESFIISQNSFQRHIPLELCQLSDLRMLHLDFNALSGKIPTCFWELEKLEELYVEYNKLNGTIPGAVGNSKRLKKLRIGFNEFSQETIPTEIGMLTNLKELWLQNIHGRGKIPSQIKNLRHLEKLELGLNEFTGEIPHEISSLLKLKFISLQGNRFSGDLPTQLGRLKSLQYLDFARNSVGGSIPLEFYNLTSLSTVFIDYNDLTGIIPSEIAELENLETLSLYGNKLKGSIPINIGSLKKMETLNLGHNKIYGSIPSEVGRMKDLRELILPFNSLSHNIPSDIKHALKLVTFDIRGNRITGCAPDFFSNFCVTDAAICSCKKCIMIDNSNTFTSMFCP